MSDDAHIDTLMIKNILTSKFQYTKFYNVTTRRLNTLSSAYDKLKKEEEGNMTNQSLFSQFMSLAIHKNKTCVNLKYRLFGSDSVITKITERLDHIFKELLLYQPQTIMNFLYQQNSNIPYHDWIHKVHSKLPKSKKKSLYINKKYDEGYMILSYYYNLIEQTDKSMPLYTYKSIYELRSYKLYFNSLIDIYPTYYTFDIDYNILLKITKIMLDNKESIPNVSKAIKDSKNKKILALSSIDKYVNSKDRTDKNSVLRYKLWYMHFGNKKYGKCFCCNKKIEEDDPAWHCGHILSDVRGGSKELDNVKPICVKCNLDMREQHMFQYMIYNNMVGCKYLSNSDKKVIKYNKMNIMYKESIPILKEIEEKKILPKAIISWWKKEIQTDSFHTLRASLTYLKTKNIH